MRDRDGVTRILLAALGGEGGGVLMNWVVASARAAGHVVQATSVPGVAQRTGSTSYYIEIAPKSNPGAVLGLVPLPGRVDLVVSSELLETARVLSAGYISPKRTTLVSSTARFYSTAEKIAMGDGRYSADSVRDTVEQIAKESFLLDLGKLAEDNKTFVSATMFGALVGTGALPWAQDISRAALGDDRSRAGFDAAAKAVQALKDKASETLAPPDDAPAAPDASGLPEQLRQVLELGQERTLDFQDAAYAAEFKERAMGLVSVTDLDNHRAVHAATEGIRRLALWMAYEDVARVADLKTRPERFERIRDEVQLAPGQVLTVTEYMKPRAEEIADILPAALGHRIMARVARGGKFPLLGKGRYIMSNGVFGYRMLRMVAALKHIRRRSMRFHEEQAAIVVWLSVMESALKASPDFAMGLGELPRVLKGYSDTLLLGKSAYQRIWDEVVAPAAQSGDFQSAASHLRAAIGAALADDTHAKLDQLLSGTPEAPPILKPTSAPAALEGAMRA